LYQDDYFQIMIRVLHEVLHNDNSSVPSVPDQSTFEIKHYIIHDEVQKGESGSPIHISIDEQISRHFGKALCPR
jgi:hypothetical protein